MSHPVICIGGALVDELFHASSPMLMATTNMVIAKKSAGGVARNVAHQLALLEIPTQLIAVFGNDNDGEWLKQTCMNAGVKLDLSIMSDVGSGKYTGVINEDGSLFTALFSNASEYLITPEYLQSKEVLLQTGSYLLADTNLSIETIAWLVQFSKKKNIPLIIEPVSVSPAAKLSGIDLNGVYMITPNEDELPAMCSSRSKTEEEQIDELFRRGVQYIWLHKGEEGSVLFSKEETIKLHAPKATVIDCTGAGDASVSGFIMAKFAGKENIDCLKTAHTLAIETLQVNGSIAMYIDQQQLLQLVSKYYSE